MKAYALGVDIRIGDLVGMLLVFALLTRSEREQARSVWNWSDEEGAGNDVVAGEVLVVDRGDGITDDLHRIEAKLCEAGVFTRFAVVAVRDGDGFRVIYNRTPDRFDAEWIAESDIESVDRPVCSAAA